MAKVLCVLYDDPVDGYPPAYARESVPEIGGYQDAQTTPSPDRIDFRPGELLGSVSGELGLRQFLEGGGHSLIVTSDKEGPDSEFERELPDAEVVISQPFWPAYLTAERIAKAPNLKLAVTAGIGSDHVDLDAAIAHGVTVAEVTYSNSISVSEQVVMMILALVRNYIPSYRQVVDRGWNIADCVARSYDLEGLQVGTVAAGRIGSAVLRRLKPFEVGLHYTDRHRLPGEIEQELGLTFHATTEDLVQVCDVVTINAPLHPETEHLFDDELIAKMKRGAYLVNTARGRICDRDAIVRALESGQLAGYAGDVWFPQPAPPDHPWRTMPHHGMTPHVSGSSLSAQARYAAGTREILECWFSGRPIRDEYLIVESGRPRAPARTPTAPARPPAPQNRAPGQSPADAGSPRRVFLRQLEYLTALARERHFGRAAEACHVSQPALSAAIRKLERELGVPLVNRQQRYDDLTPEGRALLPWAQQTLASLDGLTAEAARVRQSLVGTLHLGVIPTALGVVSLITGPLLERHPGVRVEVRSLSSIEIGRRLADRDLDAGVTYLDNEPLGAVVATPIYQERYLFLTQSEEPSGPTIGWSELAGVPLCLLTRDMQNRRIVDAALARAGVEAAPRVEANSISALLSFARTGWSCVMAHTWLALQGRPSGMRSLALSDPDITHTVGLVEPETELVHPIVRALREELVNVDIDAELAQRGRAAASIETHE